MQNGRWISVGNYKQNDESHQGVHITECKDVIDGTKLNNHSFNWWIFYQDIQRGLVHSQIRCTVFKSSKKSVVLLNFFRFSGFFRILNCFRIFLIFSGFFGFFRIFLFFPDFFGFFGFFFFFSLKGHTQSWALPVVYFKACHYLHKWIVNTCK